MLNNSDITDSYNILMDILLTAEGNKDLNIVKQLHYEQTTTIQIPSVLVPLLYAASNSVQMAIAFLPYYLKQNSIDNNHLKNKIINDTTWFTQELYPQILKFLLQDSMRTIPLSDLSSTQKSDISLCNNILLYDAESTLYPPYYGTDIHHLKQCDSTKTYYLIGDITPQALNIITDILSEQVIYGITPYVDPDNNWQNLLFKRLNFFSNTVLAGSLNMQLPFIEHYLQAGIAPLSFYHLLYRNPSEKSIINNSLCLLYNKPVTLKITDYLNYQRLIPHTDLHIIDTQTPAFNYLTILSDIA